MKTWSRKTLVTQMALAFGTAYGIGGGVAFAQALPATAAVLDASAQDAPAAAGGGCKVSS